MGKEPLWKRVGQWADAWKSVMTAISATAAAFGALRFTDLVPPTIPPWVREVASWAVLAALAVFVIHVHRRRLAAEARAAVLDVGKWSPEGSVLLVIDPFSAGALIVDDAGGKPEVDVQGRLRICNRSPHALTVEAIDLHWEFIASGRTVADIPMKQRRDEENWRVLVPASEIEIRLDRQLPFDNGVLPQVASVWVRGFIKLKGPWEGIRTVMVEAFAPEDHEQRKMWLPIWDKRNHADA